MDFEERELHFNTLPWHWFKYVGQETQGFPHYSTGDLNAIHSRSGEYSFRLLSDGGSVGFQYPRDRKQIPARPGSDFQITAYVHLEEAETCRAQMTCALTDRSGHEIPKSRRNSNLVSQLEQGPDGWARLEVYVPGDFPQARFITLGLWLLQEEQWNQASFVQPRIFRLDVRATAWFDDISIVQLPRVTLKTGRQGNVFDADEDAALLVEVEGVGASDYDVRLQVKNTVGEVIRDEGWPLAGVEGVQRERRIELPEIPVGIYHARLSIITADTVVATRSLTFGKVASLTGVSSTRGGQFGLLVLDEAIGDAESIARLTEMSHAELLKAPVWRRGASQALSVFSDNFDHALAALQRRNIELIATFSEVPDSLATAMIVGQQPILDLLTRDAQEWEPQVQAVLAQYARQIPYWQLGHDPHRQMNAWDPRIKVVTARLIAMFNRFVTDPILAVPVNSMFQVNREQAGSPFVSLGVSSGITPQQIPDYIGDYHDRGFDNVWVTLAPLDKTVFGREQWLIDFAQRLAYAKKGGGQFIFIDHPWTRREEHARVLLEPTELLLVFRTLSDQLTHSRYVGEFEIAPDVPALIFDRDGHGTIFTWYNNHHAHAGAGAPAELYLGDNPALIDIFGNRRPLPTEDGVARLHLNQWPVLLANVDSRLARFGASVSFAPQTLNATIERQRVTLRFTNCFNVPVTGRFRFAPDALQQRWSIEPEGVDFTLQPQEEYEQEIALRFPRNELGGKKFLAVQFSLDADRNYSLRSKLAFEIRLEDIDFGHFASPINGSDMRVQVIVTNNSETVVDLRSYIDLPDNERLEQSISRLEPGRPCFENLLHPRC